MNEAEKRSLATEITKLEEAMIEKRYFTGNTMVKEKIYRALKEDPTLQRWQLEELTGSDPHICGKWRITYFEELGFFSNIDYAWILQFKKAFDLIISDKMNHLDEKEKGIKIKESNFNERIKNFELLNTEVLKTESPIEKILYIASIDFETLESPLNPQFEVPNTDYRVDFQHKTINKLLIECDGKNYHNNFNKTRDTPKQNYDYKRRREIEDQGYIIENYTGSHIYNNSADVLKLIEKKADEIYDPAFRSRNLSNSRFPQGG